MSSDRDIRDRLAEGLWQSSYVARARNATWRSEEPRKRDSWLREADRLLTALQSPTVKLKIEGAE